MEHLKWTKLAERLQAKSAKAAKAILEPHEPTEAGESSQKRGDCEGDNVEISIQNTNLLEEVEAGGGGRRLDSHTLPTPNIREDGLEEHLPDCEEEVEPSRKMEVEKR